MAETDHTINLNTRADVRAFGQIKAGLAEIDRAVQMQAAAQKKAMDGTLASFQALEKATQNRARVEARAGAQIETDLKKIGVSQTTAINLWKQQATTTNTASAAMMGMASSLAAAAAGYLSIRYAIGKTVEGYKKFAESSEQYRVIQARTGETADQMNRLKDSVLEVANKYGLAREEVLGIREAFREAGYTSAEFAKNMMGPIAQITRQYGVAGREMATTLGNFMQALHIPENAEQGVEALRMISYATRTYQLDLQQLNRYAPQLAEQMAELGVKGEEGLAKVLAMLGLTRKNFGSTTLAARAMHSAMEQIGQGGKLAHIMGMDEESWGRNMEQIEESGGNFFDWYVEQLIEAKKRGYEWTQLFSDPKVRRYWRNVIEDQNGVIRSLEEIKARGKDAMEGMGSDTNNAAQATQNLANSVNTLLESLGYLADEAGVSKVMNLMAGDAVRMARALGEIIKAIKTGDFKGLLEGIDKFTGFSNYPKTTEQKQGPSSYSDLRVQGGFEAFEKKQGGGPVSGKRPYIVGERGPEMFVPGQSGSIVPNIKLSNFESGQPPKTKEEALAGRYVEVLQLGYERLLDSWDTFNNYFNSVPRQQQESMLYQLHRAIKPGAQQAIDAILGWGGASKTSVGGVMTPEALPETVITESLLRHYTPRTRETPTEPLLKAGSGFGIGKANAGYEVMPEPGLSGTSSWNRYSGWAPYGERAKRALGGPVRPGEAYMVGERGPELFTTGRAGSVTGNKVLEDLDKNTERSTDILDEIRDILQREEMDRLSGGGGGTGTGPGGQGDSSGGGRRSLGRSLGMESGGGSAGGGGGGGGALSSGSPDVNAAISAGAKEAGVSESDFKAMASIESNLNPNAQRPGSQYGGLFQIGNSEWREHGQGGNKYNASDSAMAAARIIKRNKAAFNKAYGRDPTGAELYMMHQQGTGFYGITQSGKLTGRRTLTNAQGNPYPGMQGPQTPESFEAGWTKEFNRRSTAYAQNQGGGVTPTGDASTRVRAGVSMKGVDPRLVELAHAGANYLPPGYTIQPVSGVRNTGGLGGGHRSGRSSDWRIYDKEGNPIPHKGEDTTGMYGLWSRGAYTEALKRYPELAEELRSGTQFMIPGTNQRDLMQLDLHGMVMGGRARGRAGPSLQALGPLKTGPTQTTQTASVFDTGAAPVQSYQEGGQVKRTGPAYLHEGETVIPKYADFRRSENIEDRRNVRGGIRRSLGRITTTEEALAWMNEREAATATPNRLAAEAGMADVLAKEKPWSHPMAEEQRMQELLRWRQQMEQPVTIRTKIDQGADEQFRRRAQRDITNVTTRQAAHDGWGDIGVA